MKAKRDDLESRPEISIIVPVYNSEAYLQECLESICCQTFFEFEVIIVDDGSTDKSSAICNRFVDKDNRFFCIHNANNEGPVYSRKIGFQKSRGKYIGFVDSDDWIEPDMYQKLYDSIRVENVEISMCSRYEDDESGSRKVYHGIAPGRYEKSQLENDVYPLMMVNNAFFEWGIFPGLWDKLFKRESIEHFLLSIPDSIRMGDDAACTFPCLLNVKAINILNECLYHYRQTPHSLVRRVENSEVERNRFKTLYHHGLNTMKGETYDLSNQWLQYCMFLMTPRADILYKDMEKNEFLFPFSGVMKGSKVIIYGMGLWGQRIYAWLERTGFCIVVGAADKNYRSLQKQGINVDSIDDVVNIEHDVIFITASFEKTRNAIKNDLRTRFPNEVICTLDKSIIFSKETLNAFGLSE